MSTLLGANCCLRAGPALRRSLLHKQVRTVCVGAPAPAASFSSLCIRKRHQPCRSPTTRIALQTRAFFGSSRVVTNYVDLPPGYVDGEGLPFAKHHELHQAAVAAIFPGCPHMTPCRASKLLRILHGRRVAGSLEHPELRPNTAGFTDREMRLGLEWLRANVPVDEIANAGLRAEDELRALGADPEHPGPGEDPGAAREDHSAAARSSPWLYREAGDRNVYGESIIDKIRARNAARREAEEKALDERRRRDHDEAGQQNWGALSATTAPDGTRQVAMSPKEEAYRAAAGSGLEAPPDAPRWRLLLPTTAFVALLLPLLWWASGCYTPPGDQARLPPAGWVPRADATVCAIVLANLAVWVAWRRMAWWRFMNRHAIMDMVTPRPHGAVTAIFSHQAASHLAENMFVLWLLGGLLLGDATRAEYLAVFVGSGAAGFLASLWRCVLARRLTFGLGASSAVFGVICCYFWLHRFDGFKILDLPPDPANGIQGLGIVGLIVGLNLIPAFRQLPGQKDWVSHLAGIATGIGFARLIELRREADRHEDKANGEGESASKHGEDPGGDKQAS